MALQYKTERIRKEFSSPKLRKDLQFIVFAVVAFAWWRFKKHITITCIKRTQAENRAVKARSQTHPEWRAVDLRARGWTPAQMRVVKRFVESVLNARQTIVVVKMHGTAIHFHIQVPRWQLKWTVQLAA